MMLIAAAEARRRWTVVVALATTLLAACSSDETRTAPTAAATTTTVAGTPTTTTTSNTTANSTATTTANTTANTTASEEQATVQATVAIGGGQALGLAIDHEAVWAVSFDAGVIAKVDPATDAVLTTVELGSAASALAVDGTVWVAGYGMAAATLSEIDGASAAVLGTHDVGELCCDLTSGGGSLWALDPAGSVTEIDLATGDAIRAFPIEIDRNAHTNAVHFAGSLWFSSDTTMLSRLDPESGAIDEFDVGGGVPFLARDGLLWGASATELWAVDASGLVVERVALSNSIEVLSLELDGPDIWVGIRRPGYIGAVLRLDRASGEVSQEFDDIDIPARMVVGFGSLWITDSGSDTLYRIGPLD